MGNASRLPKIRNTRPQEGGFPCRSEIGRLSRSVISIGQATGYGAFMVHPCRRELAYDRQKHAEHLDMSLNRLYVKLNSLKDRHMCPSKSINETRANQDVGQQLRTLRQSKGLTLRALARQSEVTAAALSQIENGKTSPSVSTLKKVLAAMDTTLGQFFSDDGHSGQDVGYVIPARRLVNVASGPGLRYLTPPGAGRGKSIQIMHEIYEPSADTGQRPYVHEGEEAGFCIAGLIEVTVAGRREILRPGDAYCFAASLPHRWRNAGKGRARMISACTPPSF